MSAEPESLLTSDHDPITSAFNEHFRSNVFLLNTVAHWVRMPIPHRRRQIHRAAESNIQAYSTFMQALIETEVETSEGANALAVACMESSAHRIKFFQKLAPGGNFQQPELSQTELAETIFDDFVEFAELDPMKAIQTNLNYYANGVNNDLNEINKVVEDTSKYKALSAIEKAAIQIAELGAITTGATVGNFTASTMTKFSR